MKDKSVLFRNESSPLITLENYETFFLLYVDEELNAEERRAVEAFVNENLSLQQEFQLLMQTKVEADETIVFPDKNTLFKIPATKRTVVFTLYRTVAIAAILLLAAGVFWLMPRENGTSSGSSIAKAEPKKTTTIQQTDKTTNNGSKIQQASIEPKEIATAEKKTKTVQRTNVDVAKNENPEKPIDPSDNPGEFSGTREIRPATVETTTPLVAMNETAGSGNLASKTLIVDQPAEQSSAKSAGVITGPEGGPEDQPDGENKSKLRGFFRQVKRVVGKTTHLPGEENKKLLIGNIEIAIK
jgi:hypothetical protein